MRLYNNSARKQRRIYADKKIDYFAAFQKIFCRVPASSETTDGQKSFRERRKQKKNRLLELVISQRRSRQMHERKVSLG